MWTKNVQFQTKLSKTDYMCMVWANPVKTSPNRRNYGLVKELIYTQTLLGMNYSEPNQYYSQN